MVECRPLMLANACCAQDWLEPFLPSEGLGTAALFGCQG